MQFEIRCKQNPRFTNTFGISAEKWNKYFAGHTFAFDAKDTTNKVCVDTDEYYYLPSLFVFENLPLYSEMECWLIYPQYKRRVQ